MDNPAEVADKADRIITMLPSSPNVIDVYTGPNGILKYIFFIIINEQFVIEYTNHFFFLPGK